MMFLCLSKPIEQGEKEDEKATLMSKEKVLWENLKL
jgi:hypothetical protein